MDTFLREATSSPALEDVSNWKHHICLRPFIFLQSRGTYGQVPRAPCPVVWLLAQLPLPPIIFPTSVNYSSHTGAFHSAVSFRSFKRPSDRVEAWVCLSELKKKIFFLSGSDPTDGYCLPWRQMQNNALGEKMTTPQKGCQTSVEVTEERGGSRRKRPKATTWGWAQQIFWSCPRHGHYSHNVLSSENAGQVSLVVWWFSG